MFSMVQIELNSREALLGTCNGLVVTDASEINIRINETHAIFSKSLEIID